MKHGVGNAAARAAPGAASGIAGIVAAAALLNGAAALAQDDLSGMWQGAGVRGPADPDIDVEGAPIGVWDDLPLTLEGLARAEAWNPGIQMQPIRDCWPHPLPFYAFSPEEIRHDEDRLVTITEWNETIRTIHLDGREHPPEWWLHTWQGYSTGEWTGDVLQVTTTHLKEGYLRRNGVPSSDRAVVTEWMFMLDDKIVTYALIEDPIYLTEPRWRVQTLQPAPEDEVREEYPCERREAREYDERHFTPHYLPGENPNIDGSDVWPVDGAGIEPSPAVMRVPGLQQVRARAGGGIELRHVAGSVHMLGGGETNAAVSIGEDGIVVVTGGGFTVSDEMLAAIREVSDAPIRRVIATHAGSAHAAGGTAPGEGVERVAHENVAGSLQAYGAAQSTLPTETITEETVLEINGEDVEIIPVGPAYSDGDVFVYFTGSNVIHAGAVYGTLGFPVADPQAGGRFEGQIEALNRLIDLSTMAPGFLHGEGNKPGAWPERPVGEVGRSTDDTDTLVIPSRGRLSDETDLTYYRDMLVIVRDRIGHWIEQGMSEDEVVAMRPALGWEARYGQAPPPADTESFVRTLYRELAR